MIVYLITNLINGKVYVGITSKPLKERWTRHTQAGSRCNIYHAIKKHGKENFTIEVIDTAETAEELQEKERFHIQRLQSNTSEKGYNLTAGGERTEMVDSVKEKIRKSSSGKRHSEESKRKIGQGNKGKKRTEEMNQKQSARRTGMKINYMTTEQKIQRILDKIKAKGLELNEETYGAHWHMSVPKWDRLPEYLGRLGFESVADLIHQ